MQEQLSTTILPNFKDNIRWPECQIKIQCMAAINRTLPIDNLIQCLINRIINLDSLLTTI